MKDLRATIVALKNQDRSPLEQTVYDLLRIVEEDRERLLAALKPFADLAGKLDAAPNLVGLLTEEDFKRAAAALDHEQGAEKNG